MNVHFPGFNSSNGFLVTLVAMVVVVMSMLGFFRWKKWL
jgi:Mg2+ and Co2+ transporter CorA